MLCTNDGVNYLRSEDELRQFFQAAHRVLREGGGLFLDLSTPYKLRRVLGKTTLEQRVSKYIVSTVRFVLWVVTVLIVAQQLGIPVTSLVALFSVVSLAV